MFLMKVKVSGTLLMTQGIMSCVQGEAVVRERIDLTLNVVLGFGALILCLFISKDTGYGEQ